MFGPFSIEAYSNGNKILHQIGSIYIYNKLVSRGNSLFHSIVDKRIVNDINRKKAQFMHKADSRPNNPDKSMWISLFGTLVIIAVVIITNLTMG